MEVLDIPEILHFHGCLVKQVLGKLLSQWMIWGHVSWNPAITCSADAGFAAKYSCNLIF